LNKIDGSSIFFVAELSEAEKVLTICMVSLLKLRNFSLWELLG